MFLPSSRRLLEADGSDVFINSTSVSSTVSGADVVFFVNSSYNASGEGMVDFGETDFGYSDMQTVFLACIATLLPLVFILLVAIGVRFLWRSLLSRKTDGYEDVLHRDESSDRLAVKSVSPSGNLLTDELKTSESQFTVTPGEEIEDVTSQSPLLSYGASSGSLPNDISKSANGSIITMTLKNNHLIVETEERGVTLEDGSTKTTTTKFTTSASPNEENVFVVEVQQSGTARTNNLELYPKILSSTMTSQGDIDEECGNRRSSSQRVQVHRPPDIDVDEVSDEDLEEEDEDDEEEEEDTTERQVKSDARKKDNCSRTLNKNTVLSQSDLSISSSGSNNPSYRYGNQVGYEGGHYGYPQYVGYVSSDEKSARTVGGRKPIVPRWYPPATTAMQRASSVTEGTEEESSNLRARGRYSIDVMPVSSRLLSDIQAIERQKLEDDLLQEEQRLLGNGIEPFAATNGDTLVNDKMAEDKEEVEPALVLTEGLSYQVGGKECDAEQDSGNMGEVKSEKEAEVDKMGVEETDEKLDENGASVAKERGSLPVISPELYSQIKQTTKSLIIDKTSRPGISPKFEKFRNENSQLDETQKDMNNDASHDADTNPAKSQEYENAGIVPSDHVAS